MQNSLQGKINEIKSLQQAISELNSELMKSKLKNADSIEKY